MNKRQHWLVTVLIASAVPALGAVLIVMARVCAWGMDQDWTQILSVVHWGNIAEWAVAVATILLAFVAVAQDWIRALWARPEFEVTTGPSDSGMTPVIVGSYSTTAIYLRVRVRNVGRATAKYVEVYADCLYQVGPDGARGPVTAFPSMNLKWTNTQNHIYIPRLSSEMGKHCDVCHVISPGISQELTSLAFDLQVEPLHKGHIVGPGRYVLQILVAAENRRPVKRSLEIEFEGRWSDDPVTMLRDYATIKVLPD